MTLRNIASNAIKFPLTPSVFTLELTSRCNHACKGCGTVFSHDEASLGYAKWKKIINNIRKYAFGFRISGGECTLHPAFHLIIHEIDQLNLPFVIFTNGNWLNPDGILTVVRECKNCDGLLISLQGYDAESYFDFVRVTAFESVIANIQRAVSEHIRVATNTILTKQNYQHIPEIIDLAKSLRVFSIAFSRYYGADLDSYELTMDEFRQALSLINEFHKKDKSIVINNCIPACFDGSTFPIKGCTSGITHCAIGPDGMVRPCTHSPVQLGNILENSIEVIWQSEELKYWHSLVPNECLDCVYLVQCRGGCRATALHKNLSKDPFINYQFKNKHIETSTKTMVLNRNTRLKINFKIKHHDSYFFLINRSHHVAVRQEAIPILSALEFNPPIQEIETKFGQQGLNFVGSLIASGLILVE